MECLTVLDPIVPAIPAIRDIKPMRILLRAMVFVVVGLGVPMMLIDAFIVNMIQVFGRHSAWLYAGTVIVVHALCVAILAHPVHRKQMLHSGFLRKAIVVVLCALWLLLIGGICVIGNRSRFL